LRRLTGVSEWIVQAGVPRRAGHSNHMHSTPAKQPAACCAKGAIEEVKKTERMKNVEAICNQENRKSRADQER
jgi:hypothetical protein